jgi:hypothetical protein
MSLVLRFVATLAALAGSSQVYAVLVFPPPGTGQFRLAFVTSTTTMATSPVIGYYNDFVQTVANSVPELAALGTTWSVIGSTSSVSAISNTMTDPGPDAVPTGVPIYTVTGVNIARHYDDLWDGSIVHELSFTEDGSLFIEDVWTGTGSNGFSFPFKELGTGSPVYGLSGDNGPRWVAHDSETFILTRPVYAISGILDTAAIPEPSAFLCVGLIGGLMGLGSLGWKKLKSRRNKLIRIPRIDAELKEGV